MNVLAYIFTIILLFVIGKIFLFPIKMLTKLVINAIVGGIILFLVNYIGGFWGLHIAFNIVNAIIVGVLGVPGVVLLLFI